MMSLGAMWSANNYSTMLSNRLGAAWAQKQKLARTLKKPLSPICPAWLFLAKDKTHFEIIPERAKIVRLIFWLKLRGWGKQRIASLLNRHRAKVPTWGVNGRRGMMWHVSYISKILASRTVLGEYLPFTGRGAPRRPIGGPIAGYYPAVIDEAKFLRVQNVRPNPKGPLREKAGNLFQGLLKDGEHPKFTMYYRDHGDPQGKWIYVVSNFCRANPFAPRFSWNYPALEATLLNYLADLDWSSLLADRDAQVRTMKLDLENHEAVIGETERQIKRLIQLAKAAGDVKELGDELAELKTKRGERSKLAEVLRRQIFTQHNLSVAETGKMIRQLAKDRHKVSSRKLLREAIRGQVERIELFRKLPAAVVSSLKLPRGPFNLPVGELIQARCVRIIFRNGSERWVVERDGTVEGGLRFDGPTPPPIKEWEINRDELGGQVVLDRRQSSSLKGKKVTMERVRELRASNASKTEDHKPDTLRKSTKSPLRSKVKIGRKRKRH